MKDALLPLLLVSALLVAGCATPEGGVAPADEGAVGPFEGLTPSTFGFGEFQAVKVRSWDGTLLHVDLQLPEGAGPFPVLVTYTPYSNSLNPQQELWGISNQTGLELQGYGLALQYVPRGYAVAIAHVRGSGQSGGCFTTGGLEEAKDGYEIVEWLAAQPWSNGRVALMGTSYVGTTPISTATLDPPHLTTIVPVSAVTEWYKYYFENGEPRFFGELPFGVVYTDQPLWMGMGFMPKPRNPTGYDPKQAECAAAQAQNAYAQDNYNAYWMERNYLKDVQNATAPMLYAHGFLDENTPMSLVTDFFNAYPAPKRMWLQQHGHGVPGSFEAYHEYVHRWLDHWMLDRDNGALTLPDVLVQDNRGQYAELPEWPLREGPEAAFFLSGDGLVAEPPAAGTASYRDDPRALEELRAAGLPADGTFLEFATAPLEVPLHLSGAPRVELHAASSATDTQWNVLLYDEAPDGKRAFVTRGYLDARHRESAQQGKDVEPGKILAYEWGLHSRDHHLDAGHRLVMVLSSTDKYVLPDTPGATNTVHFGESRLVLPLLDLVSVAFTDAPAQGAWANG